MGLDCTHGCWHGAYSAFTRWRTEIARLAGIPYMLMEGEWPYPIEEEVLEKALAWGRPHEGGPQSGSPYSTILTRYIDDMNQWLPIKWESLKPDALHVLLDHSDYDGWISTEDCAPLADRLEELLPLLPDDDGGGHIGNWREKTQSFIDGLRLAASLGERVDFY